MKVIAKVKQDRFWFVRTETHFLFIPIRSIWIGHIQENGILWFKHSRYSKKPINPIMARYLTHEIQKP